MCRIDAKRANWYVKKNLAVRTGDTAIQINFEPNGMCNTHEFYTAFHKDICVSCGSSDDLSKHHCVPHCFRQHFPEEYKLNTWHDIVLLCTECHDKYEKVAQAVKNSMLGITAENKEYRKEKYRMISIARALQCHSEKIPESNKEAMRKDLQSYLGVESLTQDMIEELSSRKKSHPEDWKKIVDELDDLDEFIKFWRRHFVDTMEPKFLQKGWSIDAPTNRHAI
jgi:hypothetical protein